MGIHGRTVGARSQPDTGVGTPSKNSTAPLASFYERMVDAERQILLMPKREESVVQTDEFKAMKKELDKVVAKAKKEAEDRPSLLAPEQGCSSPNRLKYKEGEPIESVCSELGNTQTDH